MSDKGLLDDEAPRSNYKKKFRVCLLATIVVALAAVGLFVYFAVMFVRD